MTDSEGIDVETEHSDQPIDRARRRIQTRMPPSQVIDERTGATGWPASGADPATLKADFEFDVDEFLRIIYEGRKEC